MCHAHAKMWDGWLLVATTIAMRMPVSIIEYSATTMAPLSTSALLLAEQLQPLATAAATVGITSLSFHFPHGT